MQRLKSGINCQLCVESTMPRWHLSTTSQKSLVSCLGRIFQGKYCQLYNTLPNFRRKISVLVVLCWFFGKSGTLGGSNANTFKQKIKIESSTASNIRSRTYMKTQQWELIDLHLIYYESYLKGSPSAESGLCFLKDIITKFCFINSILTKDISIESSFKVSFVFTAAINSKRVLNFPWLGNSLIFKNAISDVTCKYDYLNISSFPVKAVIWKEERPFILFFFSFFFFAMVHTNLHLLE